MLYDEEMMVKDLETIFKDNLNTEIDKVNTEKNAVTGDDLFLEQIPIDAYIFETLDIRTNNYGEYFVMYGIVDTPIRAASQDNYIEEITVTFQVGTFDNGEQDKSNTMYKLLRYRKALKQVIMNNPDVFRGYATPLVASLKPSAFPYSSKNIVLSIGIDIKASVTTN